MIAPRWALAAGRGLRRAVAAALIGGAVLGHGLHAQPGVVPPPVSDPYGRVISPAEPAYVPQTPAEVDRLPCAERLCNAGALAPFLRRLRNGGNTPIHILQIGDSLTIGDMIPNGWRRPLQLAHGAAGRGVMPAGKPFTGFISWGVTASQSVGWSTSAIYRPGPALPVTSPIGIAGFTQSTSLSGASIAYRADDPGNRFDRVTVCALTGPGAGGLRVSLGDGVLNPLPSGEGALAAPSSAFAAAFGMPAPATPLRDAAGGTLIDLNTTTPAARCVDIDSPALVAGVTITTTSDAPVTLTSIALMRRGPGVILSNLGVVGSQMIHHLQASNLVYAIEMAHYRPDLVVIAFGTNEAFNPRLEAAAFRSSLRATIARIRGALGPDTPILLIAPPDAATRQMAVARIDTGLSHACDRGLMVPAGLAMVRQEQLATATELRLGFWNAGLAMGGPCSSLSWQAQGQMLGDLVHINRAGGDRLGAMLAADLESAAVSPAAGPQR
ncbi:hypothetical protein GTZ99_02550 [Novosphingobium sp. FSY-8]|uniref:GDSL-like lipase/acylhydrolase family protein n=1 Tax=Novosphingobium ovatum TaxID=1908523 RepID=A0ABW9XA76_9SPHN|nr:hypothetical protein [Novosphingobium ovatum]NBC35433.1 hypothetical protein [Novosphingobium ovatum]